MGKESIPRKHHYIPRFYLRGFSDLGFGKEKGKVCVIDLRTKKHLTTTADNIALVGDYYAFENVEGQIDLAQRPISLAELMVARRESLARSIDLRKLQSKAIRPVDENTLLGTELGWQAGESVDTVLLQETNCGTN